jgi:alpha-amylase/alpha-mannosidase (GH57 family)
MIEQLVSSTAAERSRPGQNYLCIHGHFYQPPRENPFTDTLPIEPGAFPFENYNEKITSECYRPNAEAGNFAAISFDLGPTLAAWLEKYHSDVYQRIIMADLIHRQRYGVGNAMAQAYNHTILPLATSRDKLTQILWGLWDFRHRFGHDAHGMWLAETAVDLECLEIMARYGVLYTVLAPWQASTPIDPTEPYLVRLPSGRNMTAFFYNGPLSGAVSFDGNMTNDANRFAAGSLREHLVPEKRELDESQLIMVATDGELYGHHKPWRDKFLSYLIECGAPDHGFEMCTLERYMQLHPAIKEVELRMPSAWSCAHGVARWETGCSCTEGNSAWKGALRTALAHINEHASQLFEQYVGSVLNDPWAARNEYLLLRNGWESLESFWGRHVRPEQRTDPEVIWRTTMLLEAQYYLQCSFTSCGFFFEDLARIEPRNDIAFARRAVSIIWQAVGIDLQQDFLRDLVVAQSWREPVTGADLYRQLPEVPAGLLPALDL